MAFAPPFPRVFPATFDRRAAAAAAGNGLLNSLVAYWPGNEASGDLLDLHTNALHCTDTNTVTNAAGKVYATARQYTAATSERHIRPGDDALLSIGSGVDFTIAVWCYLDSKVSSGYIAGKWQGGLGREYIVRYAGDATDRFQLAVRDLANTTSIALNANTFGSPSLATWHLVIAYHDSGTEIGISVNNGVVDTTAYSGGVIDSNRAFTVGSNEIVSADHFNGRIGPVAFWKSAAGGGGVLTAAQRTALFNAGAGLAYAQFTT